MIAEVIKLLQSADYYGAGEATEIAKGKHEIVYTFKEGLRKIKRLTAKPKL